MAIIPWQPNGKCWQERVTAIFRKDRVLLVSLMKTVQNRMTKNWSKLEGFFRRFNPEELCPSHPHLSEVPCRLYSNDI